MGKLIKKATKAEAVKRLLTIADLIYSDYSTNQILFRVNNPPVDETTGELAFKPWNIGLRQVQNYVKECYQIFRESSETTIKHKLDRHLVIRRGLFRKALEAGDLRTALSIQQDIANLEGLYKLTIDARVQQEIVITGAPPPAEMPPDNPDGGLALPEET